MARKTKRPGRVRVGDVVARAVRPRGARSEADGRWYWQARVFRGRGMKGDTVWSGWATPAEVTQEIAALVGSQGPAPHPMVPTGEEPGGRLHTVTDLMEVWLAKVEREAEAGTLARTTATSYRICGRRLKGGMGDTPVARVTRARLEEYRDRRRRRGAAASTIDLDLRVLRVAWRWAQEEELVEARALPRLRVRGRRVNNHYTPTRGEIASVLAALNGWTRVAVHLLAATGARVGEIASLEWSAVRWSAGLLTLDGKTGERFVPLSDAVLDQLREWQDELPEGEHRVFGVAPSTVVTTLQTHALPAACAAAGVEPFTPHALRRAAVDRLARRGVETAAAAKLLGHTPEVMLRLYREATLGDVREAARQAALDAFPRGEALPFPDKRTG